MAKSFMKEIIGNSEKVKETSLLSENDRLRAKIEKLETGTKDVSIFKVSRMKLRPNIRDDEHKYSYEEIEELAKDIELNGQLQAVLISSDGFLLAGFRRLNAIKHLIRFSKINDEILVTIYPKKSSEISTTELLDLQFAENIQRRSIDNFQLSNLYAQLLNEKDMDQKKISEKFKKTKSFVSMVLSLQNIDTELVHFLKQFQVFGWSKEKFNMLNFLEEEDYRIIKENEKLRGIIGISKLVAIAKNESVEEQKKIFIKNYGIRLTAKEQKSKYFSTVVLEKKEQKTISQEAMKHVASLSKFIDNQAMNIDNEELKSLKKDLEKITKKINNLKLNDRRFNKEDEQEEQG